MDSTAIASAAGTAATFFSRPYVPKLAASTSAIHGTFPYPTASTSTATAPIPTAAHCNRRSRSRSSTTPNSTVTSGLMKYPNAVSTVWPWFTDQM